MSTSPEAKRAAEKLEKQVEACISMRWESQHGDMHEAVKQLLQVGLQEFADAATAKLREDAAQLGLALQHSKAELWLARCEQVEWKGKALRGVWIKGEEHGQGR